ncbi:MAG: NAD(+) synthase [Actinomycetaceae bacterium]|nr:NAD(+) synthase [Actinomycetaceae bacterium]
MTFHDIYKHGFARVGAASFPLTLGDPIANANQIITCVHDLDMQGACVVVFPELCLVGATLGDHMTSAALLDQVKDSLRKIAEKTSDTRTLFVIGAPIQAGHRIYNCAAVFQSGQLRAIIPQTYISHDGARYFSSGMDMDTDGIMLGDDFYPVQQQLFPVEGIPDFTIGVQIGSDTHALNPPAVALAESDADCIATLASDPALVGNADQRLHAAQALSERAACSLIYATGGYGESTNDQSWDGFTFITEVGTTLSTGQRFSLEGSYCLADIDLHHIRYAKQKRIGNASHSDLMVTASLMPLVRDFPADESGIVASNPPFETTEPSPSCGAHTRNLQRPLDRFPYVPHTPTQLDADCEEILNLQTQALCQRIRSIGQPRIILGVSGGLDSTQALIVAAQAMDVLGRDRNDILAYTLPGFATSAHTKNNAFALCKALGIPCKEIDIRPAAKQMLADMDHPFGRGEAVYDITFENVQAGLRTDYLFRIANQKGGFVLGTGDLSELALGWCTYGVGDHMAHYGANGGLPKTLIQYLIRWAANSELYGEEASHALYSILNTEISPELIPADADGTMQSTQNTNGPYELHDFFLYHHLQGYPPSVIAYLAHQTWKDRSIGVWPSGISEDERHEYDLQTIVKWLKKFYWRFFTQQFKRTCMPNGPQVLAAGTLSPRGGWNMPSDSSPQLWIDQLERALSEENTL